jgi:hypothetical protein
MPRSWKGLAPWALKEAGVEVLGNSRVRIPYRDEAGTVQAVRVFWDGGAAWEWPDGIKRPDETIPVLPFGLDLLPDVHERRDRALIWTEGESDTIAVRVALVGDFELDPLRGYDVLGLPGALTWRDEWKRYAEGYLAVYAIPDGDEAGEKMVWGAPSRAPAAFGGSLREGGIKRTIPHLRIVRLPADEDARGFIQTYGADALDALLDEADYGYRVERAFTDPRIGFEAAVQLINRPALRDPRVVRHAA